MLCATLGLPPMNRIDEIREEDAGLDKSHLVVVGLLQQALSAVQLIQSALLKRKQQQQAGITQTMCRHTDWSWVDNGFMGPESVSVFENNIDDMILANIPKQNKL